MSVNLSPIDLTVLKDLLGEDYAEYTEGLMGRRFDSFCDLCRERYKEEGLEFYPNCWGGVLDQLESVRPHMTEAEFAQMKATADPVTWASINLKWDADWYQAQILRCSALNKVLRSGRRIGKSDALCVDGLHKALTKPGKKEYESYTVLVVTPYDSQVSRLFDVLRALIARNPELEATVVEDVKNPQKIKFSHGASIRGFTAGVKSGNKSGKIRGEDADAIMLDEADMLTKDDLEAILAIRASHARCSILFSSTPTGSRETFYSICTDRSMRFKEFWRCSQESPRYTAETDETFLKMYTSSGYAREILAMFGDLEEGVYQKKYVDAALQDYQYKDCHRHPDRLYIMGVDWNDHKYGTHIVINEWDQDQEMFRVVDKTVVQGGQFTQTQSIQKIIDLNHVWEPKYIVMDAGYGTTNIEMLKQFGLRHPSTKLDRKLMPYNMSAKVVVNDPVNNAEIKRDIKPLMVAWSALIMERNQQIFPRFEDDRNAKGLVYQVRSFKQEKISVHGRPIYSQGYEHTLTAWALTILGFMLNETEYAGQGQGVKFLGSKKPEDRTDEEQAAAEPGEIPYRSRTAMGSLRGSFMPEEYRSRADVMRKRRQIKPYVRKGF